jgi:hypothetical protein
MDANKGKTSIILNKIIDLALKSEKGPVVLVCNTKNTTIYLTKRLQNMCSDKGINFEYKNFCGFIQNLNFIILGPYPREFLGLKFTHLFFDNSIEEYIRRGQYLRTEYLFDVIRSRISAETYIDDYVRNILF